MYENPENEFHFDISFLESQLNTRGPTIKEIKEGKLEKIPFEKNAGHFVKKAFDLWENKYDNTIWRAEEIDGQTCLVREFDEVEAEEKKANVHDKTWQKNSWLAKYDSDKNGIILSFGNIPLAKFSGTQFNFNNRTAGVFVSTLFSKIGSKIIDNIDFFAHIVANLSNDQLKQLFTNCKKQILNKSARNCFALISRELRKRNIIE